MAKSSKKSGAVILLALVGAYLIFKPKKAAAAPAEPGWSPPSFAPTGTSAGMWDTSVAIPYRVS